MPSPERSEAFKRGREIYANFVQSGDEFVVDDVKLAMRKGLVDFREEAYAALVEQAFSRAEESEKKRTDSAQMSLQFDESGVVVLDEKRRVGKWCAMRKHWEEHMKILDAHVLAVQQKSAPEHDEYKKLRRYWKDGVTYRAAVAAYRADHPNAGAA